MDKFEQGRNEKIEVSIHSVFDEGDIDNFDIYSFTPVDPDNHFETKEFLTLDEALAFLQNTYSLTGLRFVNQGVIQDEYRLLKQKD